MELYQKDSIIDILKSIYFTDENNYIIDNTKIDNNILFLKKNIYHNNYSDKYYAEIKSISILEYSILYYKNISIEEYCYVNLFFKEKIYLDLGMYYKEFINFTFDKKLKLIIMIMTRKKNNIGIEKLLEILKSIHYRLNKI